MNLSATITHLGHLATRRQLATLGFGRRAIDSAIAHGTIEKIRPGWVGTRDTSQHAVMAALRGAKLTGATALRSYGIWAGLGHGIHLQVPANAHRIEQRPIIPLSEFTPPRFPSTGMVWHWAPCKAENATRAAWRVSVTDALVRFARTENEEQVAAAIESAVHKRQLSRSAVAAVFHRLPRRLHPLKARLNFSAESGLETVGRLRLEDHGYSVVPQVQIGSDRVDLVIDGWLIIELDGDEWHDPVTDRIRTNRLIRAGYRVLRFGYVEVFDQWPNTLATIQEMLREHAPAFR